MTRIAQLPTSRDTTGPPDGRPPRIRAGRPARRAGRHTPGADWGFAFLRAPIGADFSEAENRLLRPGRRFTVPRCARARAVPAACRNGWSLATRGERPGVVSRGGAWGKRWRAVACVCVQRGWGKGLEPGNKDGQYRFGS